MARKTRRSHWCEKWGGVTGDGSGPSIREFLGMLEQVDQMGGWSDVQLIGMARCRMSGPARDFGWKDETVKEASSYAEFKKVALKFFDTEPAYSRLKKII